MDFCAVGTGKNRRQHRHPGSSAQQRIAATFPGRVTVCGVSSSAARSAEPCRAPCTAVRPAVLSVAASHSGRLAVVIFGSLLFAPACRAAAAAAVVVAAVTAVTATAAACVGRQCLHPAW